MGSNEKQPPMIDNLTFNLGKESNNSREIRTSRFNENDVLLTG